MFKTGCRCLFNSRSKYVCKQEIMYAKRICFSSSLTKVLFMNRKRNKQLTNQESKGLVACMLLALQSNLFNVQCFSMINLNKCLLFFGSIIFSSSLGNDSAAWTIGSGCSDNSWRSNYFIFRFLATDSSHVSLCTSSRSCWNTHAFFSWRRGSKCEHKWLWTRE